MSGESKSSIPPRVLTPRRAEPAASVRPTRAEIGLAQLRHNLLALGRAANDVACHPATRFDLVPTRGEIASLLGLTIETVSRQITRFERLGLIRRHGARGIELIGPDRLRQVAD